MGPQQVLHKGAVMRVQDLGELRGVVLVYGGPCSNAQATVALLSEAERRGIPAARRICTGDTVAYCAGAAAVLGQVRVAGGSVVAGNCERQIADGAESCGCGFGAGSTCDLLSRGWYPYALAAVRAEERAWMMGLPDLVVFRHAGRRYGVIHGGLTDIARYLWPVSPEEEFADEVAAITALAGPVDAVIAGHSGVAFVREVAGVSWINAGAIGLPPHDGRRETRFVVLRDDGPRIERLAYNADAAAADMRAAGLTQGYDAALLSGVWPSEDVLPATMRRG